MEFLALVNRQRGIVQLHDGQVERSRINGTDASAARPYRDPLPWSEVLGILEEDVGSAIDGRSVEALKAFLAGAGPDPLGREAPGAPPLPTLEQAV